jgi:hypothetical protein
MAEKWYCAVCGCSEGQCSNAFWLVGEHEFKTSKH